MQQIPPPLRAVNDRLSLTGSYNWGRDTIFYFLQDVLNRSAFYGVDPLKLPDLRNIWLELKRLSCPSGGDYVAGSDLEPDQHILRARNRSWQGQPNTSKFNLRSHPHNSRPYSNPYDLLGLFLSSLGPAPFAATKANFYLPLTAVYGWWCSQIAGKPIGGVGAIPYVFQCTWRKRDGEQAQFFLGSSVAGYEGRLTGSWPRIVKSGRFQLLQDTLSVDGKYGFDLSPSLINNAATGTRFGNCAETHPFLELMKDHTPADGICYGLALKFDYFQPNANGKVMTRELVESLLSPCVNCQELIRLFRGDSWNFEWNYW